MVQKLGVEESISLELCILLYKQYGTTMAGLRVCVVTVRMNLNSFLFVLFIYVPCC
jgi:hypothetical protein